MIKQLIILVLTINCFSCSSYYSRSYTEGYVYNYQTKKAIEDAEILIKKGDKYLLETKTDSNGYFSFKAKKHIKLGYDSRDLAIKFVIKKRELISKELSSYGGNDITKYDSIYLKPKKNKTVPQAN